MKLATLKNEKRDGTLVVVDRNLKWAVSAPEIAPTMQAAHRPGLTAIQKRATPRRNPTPRS